VIIIKDGDIMDSLNKLTKDKLKLESDMLIKTISFTIPIELHDTTFELIGNFCKHVYWNGYYRGANDGYDTGYLDGRDPGDYKKGW
jgi:hypothetical protein